MIEEFLPGGLSVTILESVRTLVQSLVRCIESSPVTGKLCSEMDISRSISHRYT